MMPNKLLPTSYS